MADVRVFPDAASLAEGAADEVARLVRDAIARRGECALALAGGSTPRRLYEALAGEPQRRGIDWARLQLYWGDERCVPPDDPASNYAMARKALLSRVPIPPERVHRIRGELDPERAARLYRQELERGDRGAPPRLDLVLLGLGEDGHTASLFPDTPGLIQEERLVVATHSPEPPRDRVSLTLAVINAARAVIFLVQGRGKAEVLREVLEPDSGGARPGLPAASVRPGAGSLIWLVDRSAASGLR